MAELADAADSKTRRTPANVLILNLFYNIGLLSTADLCSAERVCADGTDLVHA